MKLYKIYPVGLIVGYSILMSGCVTNKFEAPVINEKQLIRQHSYTDTLNRNHLSPKFWFPDSKLVALIEMGISNNLDMKIALERLRIAQANLTQSRLALFPTLNVDISAADNKQSKAALNFPAGVNINTETQLYRLQASSSWEIDIWGKLGAAKRSVLASYLQTEAAKRAIQTQLVGQISQHYFQLLALDEQLKITEATLNLRQKNEQTIKALKEAAVVNGAAVVQSEANTLAVALGIPDLKRTIQETENSLSLLLGKPGMPIQRGVQKELAIQLQLSQGIPSEWLKDRPDVAQSEYAFRVAFEETNVAKTYFYPSLTLGANAGVSSLKLENLFKQSLFYSLVGGVAQPIINRGQNKARLETAKANQQIAFYDFQKVILTAGNEVSNALYAYQTAREKEELRAKQIIALKKAVDFTEQLLEYSSATNYTDVLTSQQSLLNAELTAVSDRLQKQIALVSLYRALGGGWEN
ncbi:MAG: efflux transporter outer membrane subunit [Pedobacter sp.]|nr:MAG: efflux transporter outer membrane subunit [Pedobacter sp.]